MLSFKEIDAAFRETVESLKNRGADGTDIARIMLAYGGNILLQTEGREIAASVAVALTAELHNGTGFVHLRKDGAGFGSVRGRLDAASPTAGEG